jgi:ArsR family transcriptional regulator
LSSKRQPLGSSKWDTDSLTGLDRGRGSIIFDAASGRPALDEFAAPRLDRAALGALAQDTRLELFRLLVTCGPEGLPAGVIAERLGVMPSSSSFHLQQRVHAGLITQRRLSRQLIYSAEYGTMNELMAYLTENYCGRGALAISAGLSLAALRALRMLKGHPAPVPLPAE